MEIAADGGEAVDDGAAGETPVRSGAADEQVLEDGVPGHQVEMLVDHADAERERIGGAADQRRLAVDLDRPLVGRIGPEEDVHQAGLAGAVLAEEAEDVAGMEGEVDPGAGVHRAEALDDAAHGEKRRGHRGKADEETDRPRDSSPRSGGGGPAKAVEGAPAPDGWRGMARRVR